MRIPHTIKIVAASAVVSAGSLALAKPPAVSFSGGDGSSLEKAIIVKAPDEEAGVHAEHEYIRQHFPGSTEGSQSLSNVKGRAYDTIEIKTASGEKKTLYFDITAYFGKFGK